MLLTELLNKKPISRFVGPFTDTALISPEEFLGIEVETEPRLNGQYGRLSDDLSTYWSWHHDGSLRNGGLEFTFHEPLCGVDVDNALHLLFEDAKRDKWSRVHRGSIHVHINMLTKDGSIDELSNFFKWYLVFEDALYDFAGEFRAGSGFCNKNKLNGTITEWNKVLAFLGDGDKKSANLVITGLKAMRYSGLNLHSLSKYGTVEVRILPITYDFKEVIWA